MQRQLLLALALSVGQHTFARGQEAFPERNISAECKRQVGAISVINEAGGLPKEPASELYDECLEREKNERVASKKLWRKLSDEDQKYCAENSINYYALKECIEVHVSR